MNQKALKTLEYDKIIEQLASYASSPLGRKKCLELVPSSSLSQITRMQHETHDALTRLFKKGHISFGDAKDIRGALKRLEIGRSLKITERLFPHHGASADRRTSGKHGTRQSVRPPRKCRPDAGQPRRSLRNTGASDAAFHGNPPLYSLRG